MTIPKRDKKKRGRPQKAFPSPPAEKIVETPKVDRMIRNYPRQCPYCGLGSYSTICKCGRLTKLVSTK